MVAAPPAARESSSAFRRIEGETLADKTFHELKRLIDGGHFTAGDQLPPERELVKELGVSRTVLREALSTLETLGLIERRSTRGRFVSGAGSSATSRTLISAWLRQHSEEILEIDEVRSLIESHALRAASLEDIDEIAERLRPILTEQQEAIARGETNRAAEMDTQFHHVVCSVTRNMTLLDLSTALLDRSRDMALAVYAIPELAAAGLSEHLRVVGHLASGELDAAAASLREHILASSRRNVELGAREGSEVDPPGTQSATSAARPLDSAGGQR